MALELKKIKVLVVEDESRRRQSFVENLRMKNDSFIEILECGSEAGAIELARHGDIAFCILDLMLPEQDGPVIRGVDDIRGIGLARKLHAFNSATVFYFISNYSDERLPPELTKLRAEGIDIDEVIDKKKHVGQDARVIASLLHPSGLTDALALTGTRVVHLREYQLARKLWSKAAPVPQDEHLGWKDVPMLTLRGPSQMGKDVWARTFARWRWMRHENKHTDEPYVEFDLSNFSKHDLSLHVALFGSRNMHAGSKASPGVFVQATAYHGVNRSLPSTALPTSASSPDYRQSYTLILQELGNLPTDLQSLLLRVTQQDGGRIRPMGYSGDDIRIGCPIVFTTNAPLEEMVVQSAQARDRDFRGDLFKRLNAQNDGWLYVPSFAEMGVEAFFAHVNAALRDAGLQRDWGNAARIPVLDTFNANPAQFSMDMVAKIVAACKKDSEAKEIMWKHVNGTISPLLRNASAPSVVGPDENRKFEMAMFELAKSPIAKPGTKKHLTLQAIIEKSNQGQFASISELAQRSGRTDETTMSEVSKMRQAIEGNAQLGCEMEIKNWRVQLKWLPSHKR